MAEQDFRNYLEQLRKEMLAAIRDAEQRILTDFHSIVRRLYGSDDGTTGDVYLLRSRLDAVEDFQRSLRTQGVERRDIFSILMTIITVASAAYVAYHAR